MLIYRYLLNIIIKLIALILITVIIVVVEN